MLVPELIYILNYLWYLVKQIIANLRETTLKVSKNSDLENLYAWEYDIVTIPTENLDLVMSVINKINH